MKQPVIGQRSRRDVLEKACVAETQYEDRLTREQCQMFEKKVMEQATCGFASQTAERPPEGEILGLASHLGNSFDRLEEVVTVLEQKVGAVLRPSEPYNAGPESTANTQLGCALSIFVNRANALIKGLEALTGRIEL